MHKLVKLSNQKVIKPFSCTDTDLNNFLFEDARNFTTELLAVTYLIESKDDNTVAYFSLLNDKVDLDNTPSNERNRFNRPIPNHKRYKSYPSVKVGRLAVSSQYSGQGIGSKILTLIKEMFTQTNKTGCRYITVDAYAAAIPFYLKNDFKFLTDEDAGEDTRLMYYDLKRFI